MNQTRDARPVELDDLPKNEVVRIIRGISRVAHTPTIVEGRTSSTGKTIEVPKEMPAGREADGPPKDDESIYRLDAEDIFTDGLEVRGATTFKLYTPSEMRGQQKANYAPGPQAGTNDWSDEWDLPPATHLPARPEGK